MYRRLSVIGLKMILATVMAVAGISPVTAQTEPDPAYWSLDEIRTQLATWQTEYPDIFQWTTIGYSGLGEALDAVRISDQAFQDEAEPGLIFQAAQHANECNGTTAIMCMMGDLLKGYGDDQNVTDRVDGLELWFVPVANPDGHAYVFGENADWADWRKTLRDNNENDVVDYPDDGVDLNRNWDWYWDEYSVTDPTSQKFKGPEPFSEPETVALRDMYLDRLPVLIVDYHSPVTITWKNYIFYPWISQHGYGISPDRPVAKEIAEQWAAATLTETGACFQSVSAYDTLPKQQCWSYGRLGIVSYLMEIAEQCWWSDAMVDTIGARVARGSTYLMDRTLHGPGLRGNVTDAATGLPLVGEVRILEMHSDEIGPRLTDDLFGRYYRLTLPGSFTLEVNCEGFLTQTVGVSVPDSGWVETDFALQPDLTPVPDSGIEEAPWLRFANPLPNKQAMILALPTDVRPVTVELFDMRGRRVALLGEGLPADTVHTLQVPRQVSAGVYLLRAKSATQQRLRRVVLVP